VANFRELRRLLGRQGEVNFTEWLEYHWNNFVADFNIGMQNLDLDSNFKSYRETVTITDGAEVAIRHGLGVVPSGHLVLNGIGGVVRGTSNWTRQNAFLILDSDLYTGKSKEVDVIILA
jgi:hypothetical protein